MGSGVLDNLSDNLITVCFLRNEQLDSSGIAGHLPKIISGECLGVSKFISPVDAKVLLSKSFGCGICDELFEVKKEFLEHCSSHRLSPPDDLVWDLVSADLY